MTPAPRPSGARFVTFEGIDGAGKSTHLTWFAEKARERVGAQRVVVTREPGGTPLGEALRALLLHEPMHPDTEALLMFAARREHLARVIEPALARGDWVLSDRFTDASFAYQGGGRGVDAARLQALEHFTHPTLQPDLTLVFDLDPNVAERRRLDARAPDRFEAQARAFHERTRRAYLDRAKAHPGRVVVVDAALTPSEIHIFLQEIILTI